MNDTAKSRPAYVQSEAARAYWASIVQCVAGFNGRTEIVHANGWVECFDAEGRAIRRGRQHFQNGGSQVESAGSEGSGIVVLSK